MTIIDTNQSRMSDDESDYSDMEDSDTELQKAFQKGELKDGLNLEVIAPTKYVNNTAGLKQKAEDLRLRLDWVERLDMTNKPAPATPGTEIDDDGEDEDVDNDFKRELKFYRQAQATVLESIPKLNKLGILTRRPEDYFAQMAKSDDHMKRVREKLLTKQMGMERSEKAKKMRELRKYGKKVQQGVLQKRQKEKKEMMEAVKKYRSGQKNKLDFLEKDEGPRGKNQKKEDPSRPVNKKRLYKNSKFGFGGQKKRSKHNTSQSTLDMSGVNSKASFSKPGKGRKLTNKNKRPGKNRRQNMKNKKKS